MIRDLSATPIPQDMEGELRAAFEAFRSHQTRVRDLTQGLSDAAFNHPPGDPELGAWSVGECVHHLNLMSRGYLNVMTVAIAEARARSVTGRGPFTHGWLGKWIVRQMEPPPRRKHTVPRPVDPAGRESSLSLNDVVGEFHEHRLAWFIALEAADGLVLNRIRVVSPFKKLIRFDLGIAFALVAAHERRHLWQAGRVREAPDFPGA